MDGEFHSQLRKKSFGWISTQGCCVQTKLNYNMFFLFCFNSSYDDSFYGKTDMMRRKWKDDKKWKTLREREGEGDVN